MQTPSCKLQGVGSSSVVWVTVILSVSALALDTSSTFPSLPPGAWEDSFFSPAVLMGRLSSGGTPFHWHRVTDGWWLIKTLLCLPQPGRDVMHRTYSASLGDGCRHELFSEEGLQKHLGSFCTCPSVYPNTKRLVAYLPDKEPVVFLGIQPHRLQAPGWVQKSDPWLGTSYVLGAMDTGENKRVGHLPAWS